MTKSLSLALILAAAPLSAQPTPAEKIRAQAEYTRAHYTKFDFRIPMRDGVKLYTTVYAPKDASRQYHILMERTPYSVAPYGVDNYRTNLGPSELFTKEGFIFVYQDVRGRYLSEGQFVDVPVRNPHLGPNESDESTDTYDTIDWLVKNIPNNNGRAGIWGISYPGFYAAFALINAHPALKAVSPQAPMGDVGNGDDAYHNGAFYLAANFGFYTFFKPRPEPERPKRGVPFDYGTPDEYDFYLRMGPLANANALYLHNQNAYWDDMLKHPNYDDFWQSRALAPYMKHVTPAVLWVGGWFDAEDLAGPLKLFYANEKAGPAAPQTLIMGPWPHGGWSHLDGDKLGNLSFASKTGEFYRESIELPFFVANLKGQGNGVKPSADSAVPKAWLFETGTNEWIRFGQWPPKDSGEKALYLGPGGTLSFTAASGDGSGYDEYVSDPAKPVPVTAEIGAGMPSDYMTHDQRFAARRTDVLVYQTGPLEKDVTIAGPIQAVLEVSSSGTDSDFVVKLIDVYPNDYPDPDPNPAKVRMGGYQQMVRGEPFRGKFRNGFDKPEPFVPGQKAQIAFTMPDICHVFRSGHRIMVQIQSSWFPLTDRNPQVFLDIPAAKAMDFKKATERVYVGGPDGSRLRVRVIE